MQKKVRGIVLRKYKYSETSIVVKIFTDQIGLKSFLVSGVRKSGKSTFPAALWQPLSVLNLVVYDNDRKSMNRIKEAKFLLLPTSIPFNVVKSNVALFIAEVVFNVLEENAEDESLFNYVLHQITQLDSEDVSPLLLIDFLTQLLNYLGCLPPNNFSTSTPFFNPIVPCFEVTAEGNWTSESSELFSLLLTGEGVQKKELVGQKGILLERLLEYLQHHVPSFKPPQSLAILRAILS